MARIQILELPEGTNNDRPPFVLVVDETAPQHVILGGGNPDRDYWQDIADKIGARGVIVTPDTIDIPANDVPLDEAGQPLFLKVHVEGEFEQFREQVQDEIRKAQAQVTRALQERDPVHERANIARDRDRLAKWKDELADALGMDRTRDWDDIRNAAAGLRGKCDEQAAKIERILRLSETPQQGTGVESSDYLNGYRDAIRWVLAALSAPVDDQTANAEESTGRPTHPDGTPYNYSEIVAEGWEHCDGCRTWGQWTITSPHNCPGTHLKGPALRVGPGGWAHSGDTERSPEE